MNIKTDSRKITKGDTFVALKGNSVDGHDYIEQAIKNGASRIVCEHGTYSVETINVSSSNEWLHEYLKEHYEKEINEMIIIGITGTNGKTTTAYLTYQTLKELGIKTCYIGTIGCMYNDLYIKLENTTPNILELYDLILDAKKSGITHVVMEVSSHSLELNRIDGIKFKTVVFTNLTEDHLDFHKTMENYLNAKLKILNYLSNDGIVIINNDDEYGKFFKTKNNITFGFNKSDLTISSYEEINDKTKIKFNYKNKDYEVNTNLVTKFNVYNYVTCILIVNSLGISIEDIINVSNKIYPPKGRCEKIKYKDNDIIIDYAHTPDAVEKIIETFDKNKKGKIITIVGCGGDRDPYKRPLMGKIATEKSDYVIFTSDNPRTEDPNKILNDIVNGLRKNNYEIITDRIEAIQRGIDLLTSNDILLVLGKGHEDYQIIGKKKYHLDDFEEVKKYIEYKNSAL